MKRLLLLLAIVLSYPVCAQETWFSSVSTPLPALAQEVKNARTLKLNLHQTKSVFQSHPGKMEVWIPFPEGPQLLSFIINEIHAADFKVLDAGNRDVTNQVQFPLNYRNQTSGTGKNLTSLTIFPDGHIALVHSDKKGNYNLGKLPEKYGIENGYVGFYDHNLVQKNPFHCGIDHDGPVPSGNRTDGAGGGNSIQDDTSCRLTEIYWECDYDMYQKGGNSIQGALNQFEAMFNGTAILFENETINIGVKAVKVWNTPDPYTYTSSFTALDDFQDAGNLADWPGQLAHLLSTRPLNLGGVAYLNALCTNFRYAFSNIDFFFSSLPVYSWTLSTIAHELGHNFSSPHTHNCNWEVAPGEFGQIDSCWNAEGNCQPDIRGRVGTIMSYCHLTGSVNLSLGFGPLPGDRIREAYADMPCVAGTIVIPNFTPLNSGPFCVGDTIQLLAPDLPGYSYSWSGPNGYTSSAQNPLIINVNSTAEGNYGLSVKKASCASRIKKTEVVFNCMPIGSLPTTICAGAQLSIPFTSTGVFNSGNLFVAQLSSNTGSFANPILLDTLASNQPGTLQVTIPVSLTSGPGYKVRLVSTSPQYDGKPPLRNLQINALGAPPSPRDGERCGPGSVQISANGGSSLLWFPDLEETVPVFSGRNFLTPVLPSTKSFFVQSGGTSKSRMGLSSFSNPETSQESDGILFSASGTLRIDSIRLEHPGTEAGQNLCRLTLEKDGIQLFQTQVTTSGSGSSKVPLFWRVDPGHGYSLRCDNIVVPMHRSQAGWGNFPISQVGTLIFEGSLSGNGKYPYLLQWVLNKYSTCPSRRIEVKAVIKPGTVPNTPFLTQIGDSVWCSETGIEYQWQINGTAQSQINTRKIRGLQNSSYQVRIKLDSCWSDWSAPLVVNITGLLTRNEMEETLFFPNPSTGLVQMRLGEENVWLELYSPEGKRVWSTFQNGNKALNFNHLPKGIYNMLWHTDRKSGNERLQIK